MKAAQKLAYSVQKAVVAGGSADLLWEPFLPPAIRDSFVPELGGLLFTPSAEMSGLSRQPSGLQRPQGLEFLVYEVSGSFWLVQSQPHPYPVSLLEYIF